MYNTQPLNIKECKNEMIEINVNGIKVEGEITYRSRADINIQIKSSYQLGTGMHIPYFALEFHDYRGPYGDETAARLLEGLYNLCEYIEKNKETLVNLVAEMDDVISKFDPEQFITKDQFHEIRVDLRKQLRSGLDLKIYQKLHGQANKKMKERQCKIWRLKDVFFENNFPFCVSICERDRVLEILRTK